MSDLELKAYDIKAGYVAWCRGEITKQQAEEAFDWFVRALKAEAWDEGYAAGQNDYSMESDNPYRDN